MKYLGRKLFAIFWIIFVWLDYTIRHRRFPKTLNLTRFRDVVRINGELKGFYSDFYFHYQTIYEIDKNHEAYPDRIRFDD